MSIETTNSGAAAPVGIAYVGCGYVADLYGKTLGDWSDTLDLRGVWDRNPDRLAAFTNHYGLNSYPNFDSVLADEAVQIVVNLTNPSEHYAISKQILMAGKHVYSEKPLALDVDEAAELVALAAEKNLHVVAAPSSVLGDAAQELWHALRRGDRGTPKLVYAEMDDGMVHRIGYENWRTESGAYWPAKDEFQTGCTLEHAGYALTWMVAMFGSVERLVTFAKCVIPDKGPDTPANLTTPDFTCAVLEFENGVVARLTNSIIAPHDHHFRVFCDEGSFEVPEVWDFTTPVRSIPLPDTRWRRQAEKRLGWDGGRNLNASKRKRFKLAGRGYPMDFVLGIVEMAKAVRTGAVPRLAGDFSLHITEVSLAIQHPERFGSEYHPKSRSGVIRPMNDESEIQIT